MALVRPLVWREIISPEAVSIFVVFVVDVTILDLILTVQSLIERLVRSEILIQLKFWFKWFSINAVTVTTYFEFTKIEILEAEGFVANEPLKIALSTMPMNNLFGS